MDDPEAPVVDDGEVGVRALEQRGQVEDWDGHGRVRKSEDSSRLSGLLKAGLSARNIRNNQKRRPTASKYCQNRPGRPGEVAGQGFQLRRVANIVGWQPASGVLPGEVIAPFGMGGAFV